ncbi:MAG TPA: lysophospholipid acyltransferase family protein [Stellaceae bacterium]|nr:lysophospholipid acyltransferase family protein [Stellaceae bacterium]
MVGLEGMGSTRLRLWRLTVYLVWTLALMPVQAVGLLLRRPWAVTLPRFYHRACCRILGIHVRRIGEPTANRPALFASNHVSYLDITALGSILAGGFVAKAEVASWPLFGWLAKMQRCVFVDRQVRSTAEQRDAMSERLANNEALILFPEGTSHDGNRVLPFKSALFSAVVRPPASPQVAVQPVSVTYARLDGLPIGRGFRPLFAWYGDMAMAPHLWRMIGLGTLEVVIEFHTPTTFAECGSRKALAAYCEARAVAGVNAALTGRRQPAVPAPPPRERAEPVAIDIPAAAT